MWLLPICSIHHGSYGHDQHGPSCSATSSTCQAACEQFDENTIDSLLVGVQHWHFTAAVMKQPRTRTNEEAQTCMFKIAQTVSHVHIVSRVHIARTFVHNSRSYSHAREMVSSTAKLLGSKKNVGKLQHPAGSLAWSSAVSVKTPCP